MTEALRLTNLTRSFGDKTVLANVDLRLARGDRLAAVGYSGSGKTTLLRLIAGLDVPTAGEVSLAGRVVSAPGQLIVPPERRRVAMVFQGLALFPHLRALDQITFAAKGHGGVARAKTLLEKVGLAHRAAARMDQLSGGERQRVALARALAQEPDLLLMDEPFASLDEPRRAEMRDLLRALLDGFDATLILVTHARDDALDLARRVLVLDAGHPVASDTLAALLANPPHAAVVRCLGLGQLLPAQADGPFARTAFGPVPLARPTAAGRIQLLIRPGQARVHPDGVEAEVLAIEPRPPDASGNRSLALVSAADQTLRVDLHGEAITVGQRVCVRIEGPCLPLAV